MAKRFSHTTQQTGCCLLLALGCLLHSPGIALSANASGSKKPAPWPTRNFLPPIATINPRMESHSDNDDASLDGAVTLSAVNSPVLRTSPPVTRLDNSLMGQVSDTNLAGVGEIRKKVEEADLEHLWQAVVEKNPVIRFSLEKLATPGDLQTRQSSRFLSRTLSTMISGATMAATMMPGGGAYRNMASVATGNALQNLASGRTQPTVGCLSATEQIQLAGLIDDLKLKLIRTYEDYQSTLQSLAQSRETTAKNSRMYSQALTGKNGLAIMATSRAYYQALINETTLRQQARLQRLSLERMAGKEAVSQMELAFSLDGESSPTIATPLEKPLEETTASLTPIGPEPLIGPDAPSAPVKPPSFGHQANKAKTPAAPKPGASSRAASLKNKPTINAKTAVKPMDLPPQAMLEIGPSQSEGLAMPLPLHFPAFNAPQPLPTPASGSRTQQSTAIPLPISDKILDAK